MVRVAAALLLNVLAITSVAADQPTLAVVLTRAAAYVAAYQKQLEMRETYTISRSDLRIDGRATFGRFRQFTVSTTEKPKS